MDTLQIFAPTLCLLEEWDKKKGRCVNGKSVKNWCDFRGNFNIFMGNLRTI